MATYFSVQNNLMADNASRMLGINSHYQAESARKLSSGYRINKAADDAAGLGISEKMRRQIRGLKKATENVNDGIDYCQVAEGALQEVTDMIQRMNELAVKAANGTLSDSDRGYINDYFKSLKTEVQRVFDTTTFNEIKIWEGDGGLDSVTPGTPVASPYLTINQVTATNTITAENKGYIPDGDYLISATSAGMVVRWKGYDGYSYQSSTIPIDFTEGTHSFNLEDHIPSNISGCNFIFSYTVGSGASESDIVNALNGIGVSNSGNASEYGISSFEYHLGSDRYWVACSATIEALIASDYYEGDYASVFHMVDVGDNAEYTVDSEGNVTFTGIKYTVDGLGSITAKPYLIVSERLPIQRDLSGTVTIDDVQYLYNEQCVVQGVTSQDYSKFFIKYNMYVDGGWTKYNGTVSNDPVGSVVVNIAWDATPSSGEELLPYLWEQMKSAYNDFRGVGISLADKGKTYTSTSKGDAYNADAGSGGLGEKNYRHRMMIQAGSESTEADRIYIDYDNLSLSYIGLENTNTSTVSSASAAIDEVKNALSIISGQRTLFGSYINRLEHTEEFLGNTVENTSASETQIRDTDIATEMVKYSTNNILTQAGYSMLAQANKINSGILNLLK